MPSSTGVVAVGIDAAEPRLLLQWAADGTLPVLARLLERSAHGAILNPPGLYVGAVWPTFWTARSPCRHGRYCHTQLIEGTYRTRAMSPTDVSGEAFWEALSRAGRRVAVFDVPKAAPTAGINGIQIVDWATHDPDFEPQSWPAGLAAELAERFGVDALRNCNGRRETAAQFAQLRDSLCERAARRTLLARQLLERPWDLFLMVFSESHCAGHQCWHLHDPSHVRHDPALAREVGDPLRDVYAAIDRGIGAVLERAGPDTAVLVFSSHGMGPHYDATFYLDRILRHLQGARPRPAREAASFALQSVWERLPARLRAALAPLRDRTKAQLRAAARDVSGDPFFQVPNNDHHGAIRINLLGREPQGRVQPGAECDARCKQLAEDLQALVNLDTGGPAVRRVFRADEVYPGEDLSGLPDLFVEWSREAPLARLWSPRTGEVRGTYRGCRTGDHLEQGLFLFCAPGVRPQAVSALRMQDLGPTLSALLGVELPDVDGRDCRAHLGLR
jgi:predicted AlkP superfamily phosphohydrolase/phosphomutase